MSWSSPCKEPPRPVGGIRSNRRASSGMAKARQIKRFRMHSAKARDHACAEMGWRVPNPNREEALSGRHYRARKEHPVDWVLVEKLYRFAYWCAAGGSIVGGVIGTM